jgi:methionine synthase I (cobalamin-dependent)/5,10-methylenetetrahydrofolate reductase
LIENIMGPEFPKYVQENIVLADGALGSYLYEKGVELGRNLDLLNLSNPDLVFSAHEEYIRAGSQMIETNTFGANRFKLMQAGADDKVGEVNRIGAEIAVRAAGHQVFVAGSVGPTGVRFPLELGEVTEEELNEVFCEQFRGLAEGGVDLFILETFGHFDEIRIAIRSAGMVAAELPIVAQMVFPAKARTREGLEAGVCAEKLLDAGAAIVGTNCGRGVDATLEAIRAMSDIDRKPLILSAFPNAGLPEIVGHRTLYPAQPAYMATRAAEMIRLGVHVIGGCCGTSPAHIHQFKKTLPIRRVSSRVAVGSAVKRREAVPGTAEKKGSAGAFLSQLPADRLPVLVELDPPHHLDIDKVMDGAVKLAAAGVNAISLGENPLAILRTGNLGLARLIREKTGLQTIIHQTGRDLNALGLQSRMMEAHLLGIEAVLAVTGDAASGSDQPDVTGVFDLDSFGLIRMLDRLNKGTNLAGQSIKRPTEFSIGAAFSFRLNSPSLQISRLEKKAALGARFAMTQPLFSSRDVETMLEKVKHVDILVFPGIFPLISARNAEFLHNEVPGISVPEELRRRLAKYPAIEDQRSAAMEYTHRMVETVASWVDGLYLISPLNKWEIALAFVEQVRRGGWRGSGRHIALRS